MRTLLDAAKEARKLGIRFRDAVILVALQMASSAFEVIGLASFVPIFQFLEAKGDITELAKDNKLWSQLVSWGDAFGTPVTLGVLLGGCLIAMLSRQALSFVAGYYEFFKREQSVSNLRARLFGQFLGANLDAQDRASSGGMVADMTINTLRAVQHIFSRFSLATLLAICAVYSVGMFIISPRLTMLIFGIIAFSGLVVLPLILRVRKYGKQFVVANKDSSSFVVERLKLARLVRLSGMETVESARIAALSDRQRNASVRIWRTLAVVDTLIESIVFIGALLFIYFATAMFGVPVEVVGLIMVMLLRLVPIVRQIARTKQFADAARASYDTIVGRLQELDAGMERFGKGTKHSEVNQGIRLTDVTFSYEGRPNDVALNKINLFFKSGTTTAIVGPSGSGKSTLVDMLPRLRTPKTGQIEIDGHDISKLELGALREVFAFVPQTPLIFDVPLAEHIRYGSAKASMQDIKAAAWLAGADAFIEELADGFDTKAGEGGKMLSGGQRQRLDLARALLSKAPVLILDEPTSSLDPTSIAKFKSSIERIRENTKTTIIIISHEATSMRSADQVVVMNHGEVEDFGTHEELIAQGGWYASAFVKHGETDTTSPGVNA